MALTRAKAKNLLDAKANFHRDNFHFQDSDPLILFCNTKLITAETFSKLIKFLLDEYQKVTTSQTFTTHICKTTLTEASENDHYVKLIPGFESPRNLGDNEVPCTIENFEKLINH